MNKEQAKEHINELLQNKVKLRDVSIMKVYPELYEEIMSYTKFLDDVSFRERIYCYLNDISEKVKCPVCKEKYLVFDDLHFRYKYGCDQKCSHANPVVKKHKIDNLMNKYHVTNAFQIPEVREHTKKKLLEEHGDENWNNRDKAKETYKNQTGYDNASQNPIVKKKKRQTCLKNNGVDNPSKSKEIQGKKIDTCRKSSGVDFGYLINKKVVYCAISKLNKRIYEILERHGIKYKGEFRLETENGRYRSYDILIEGTNILLEINGDFWHCNPKKYTKDQSVNYPHIGLVTVESVWKRDEYKKKLAEQNGFSVFYIWESDMRKMTDEEIFKFIDNILKSVYNK